MKKIVVVLLCFNLTSSLMADSDDLKARLKAMERNLVISDRLAEKRANELERQGVKDKMKDISPELMQKAEKLVEEHNKVAPKVEDIIRDNITFDEEGRLTLFATKDNQTFEEKSKYGELLKVKNGKYFDSDERFLIFISSSLPDAILENYKYSIKALGLESESSFLLRGCVPAYDLDNMTMEQIKNIRKTDPLLCGQMRPTMDFSQKVLLDDDNETGLSVIRIDPEAFKNYGITRVPTVVYVKGIERKMLFNTGSEHNFDNLKHKPRFWKSEGDWSLDYHIRRLREMSKEDKLEKLYRDNISATISR